MSTAEEYRQLAAECRRLADAAVSRSVRETLRDVANTYLALAGNEERSSTTLDVAANGQPRHPPPAHG